MSQPTAMTLLPPKTHRRHDRQNMPPTRPLVVLIHGLHMHAWVMRPLAKQLGRQGYHTRCFGYYSMVQDLATHSQRLQRWLSRYAQPQTPIYLVGHSLGGLVIRDFLSRYPQLQVPRCVTIGTPHNGSISAHTIVRYVPSFVGQAYFQGLDGHAPLLPQGVALGSIAGSRSVGLGKLILPSKRQLAPLEPTWQVNDGTVFVHETKLIGAADHLVLPASHTGLLWYPPVAQQVDYFLRQGKFLHS